MELGLTSRWLHIPGSQGLGKVHSNQYKANQHLFEELLRHLVGFRGVSTNIQSGPDRWDPSNVRPR